MSWTILYHFNTIIDTFDINFSFILSNISLLASLNLTYYYSFYNMFSIIYKAYSLEVYKDGVSSYMLYDLIFGLLTILVGFGMLLEEEFTFSVPLRFISLLFFSIRTPLFSLTFILLELDGLNLSNAFCLILYWINCC